MALSRPVVDRSSRPPMRPARRAFWTAAVTLIAPFALGPSVAGASGPSPPGADPAFLERLRGMVAERRYAEADSTARAWLSDADTVSAPRAVDAEVLQQLVIVLYQTRNPTDPELVTLAHHSVSLARRTAGPDSDRLASSLARLARIVKDAGDYDAARAHLDRGLAIVDRPDADPRVRSGLLVGKGQLLDDLGRFDDAIEVLTEALAIRERELGPDHPDVADACNDLAIVMRKSGEPHRAVALYERALRIRRAHAATDRVQIAYALNNLGIVRRTLGDYAEARACYEESNRIKEEILGPDHVSVARGLTNLGNLLYLTGDYDDAIRNYERSLAIKEAALGPDHPSVAATILGMAGCEEAERRYDAALPLLERAHAIREAALGSGHPLLVQTLTNLGLVRILVGDRDGARPLLTRALALGDSLLGPEHFLVASTHDAMGRLAYREGRPREAIDHYTRSLDGYADLQRVGHPRIADVLARRARAYAAAGLVDDALADALTTDRLSREHFMLTATTLPERQVLRYAWVRPRGTDLALELASAHPAWVGDAWDAVIRSRALVLDEMARRSHTVSATTDPEVAALADSLLGARGRLANILVRGPGYETPEAYEALIEDARHRKEALERALTGASAEARRQETRRRAGFAEVHAALPPGDALLAYARPDLDDGGEGVAPGLADGRARYVALVVRADAGADGGADGDAGSDAGATAGARPHLIDLGETAVVDSAIARWRQALAPRAGRGLGRRATSSGPDPATIRARGRELRRLLWDPVAPFLGDAPRVFVVPDGAIHLVNLSALPTDDGRYLVEDDRLVHLLGAERDLSVAPDPATGDGLLAVGDPAFANDAPPHRRFRPLPAAGDEARAVADAWRGTGDRGPVTLLLGGDATESRVRDAAPGKRILHLATHGTFGEVSVVEGRGASVRDALAAETTSASGGSPALRNPLLRSGLALAGAGAVVDPRAGSSSGAGPRPGVHDGILTAEEIAAIDLHGVGWAVLSACDTGVGTIHAGEGVLGLRRAFEVAGARSVIMSLWPVDDEAARAWMTSLYTERLVHGASTAEAVRAAARAGLQRQRDAGEPDVPTDWAAFVAAGDWR